MREKEYSERALALTEQGIELLALHYTTWIYRFDILKKLHKDLYEELDWCEQIALDNEKNYQIWNYRQLVINEIENTVGGFDPHREYPVISAMLESDAKNHHVWSYKKWLVERFDLYEDPAETAFVDGCILMDLRNNSAWAHRFFLKFDKKSSVAEDTILAEIAYVQQNIDKSPQNPSAWNYLIGVYEHNNRNLAELEQFCIGKADISTDNVSSSYALELLARIYSQQKKSKEADQAYDLLISKYDPIRRNYWNFQKKKLMV